MATIAAVEWIKLINDTTEILGKSMDKEIQVSPENELFKVQDTENMYLEKTIIEDLPNLQLIPMRTKAPELSMVPGKSKRIYVRKVAGKLSFDESYREWAKVKTIALLTSRHRQSAVNTRRSFLAQFFEYGDTAAASVPTVAGFPLVDPICADTGPVFANSHTFRNSANTWDNLFALAPFTRANVQAHITAINLWKNSVNVVGKWKPIKVVIPISLQFDAREVLGSTQQPETAYNAINALREYLTEKDLYVYPDLINQAEWYYKINDAEFDYCFVRGRNTRTRTYREESIDVDVIEMDELYALGCADPHGYAAVKT